MEWIYLTAMLTSSTSLTVIYSAMSGLQMSLHSSEQKIITISRASSKAFLPGSQQTPGKSTKLEKAWGKVVASSSYLMIRNS